MIVLCSHLTYASLHSCTFPIRKPSKPGASVKIRHRHSSGSLHPPSTNRWRSQFEVVHEQDPARCGIPSMIFGRQLLEARTGMSCSSHGSFSPKQPSRDAGRQGRVSARRIHAISMLSFHIHDVIPPTGQGRLLYTCMIYSSMNNYSLILWHPCLVLFFSSHGLLRADRGVYTFRTRAARAGQRRHDVCGSSFHTSYIALSPPGAFMLTKGPQKNDMPF